MTDLISGTADAGVPGTAFYVPITNADGSAGWERVSVANLLKSSLIGQQTLGAAAASITFAAIPATFTDLILTLSCRGSGANAYVCAQFNGDTGANYDFLNSDTFGGAYANSSSFAQTRMQLAQCPGSANTAGMCGVGDMFIGNYAGTAFRKKIRSDWTVSVNATEGLGTYEGQWRSVLAINSITLFLSAGNFDVGTKASLYGQG